MNQNIVGREGQVTQVLSNGWVNIFIPSLKLNEHVQQRYLAHIAPGRLLQSCAAQLAHEGRPRVPAHSSAAGAAAAAALSIADFPELPQDLDLMSHLDGDLFGEHASSLGEHVVGCAAVRIRNMCGVDDLCMHYNISLPKHAICLL